MFPVFLLRKASRLLAIVLHLTHSYESGGDLLFNLPANEANKHMSQNAELFVLKHFQHVRTKTGNTTD